MAEKEYCKRCSILLKGVFGFKGGMELADGIYCRQCGEKLRQQRINQGTKPKQQPTGWQF